jgi:transcriptional regulator with XRE-family HTH domain
MNTTLMTGAELQTLREACHLSRENLGELTGVAARTVKHWEHGRSGVPADVADLIRRVDALVSIAANEALSAIKDATASAGAYPADVVLLRYNTEEAERYHIAGQMACLGPMTAEGAAALQGAIVNRVRLTLPWFPGFERVPVRIVWMQSAAYEAWRAAQGLADSEATRSAWAGEQVTVQAKPHRADQPPI